MSVYTDEGQVLRRQHILNAMKVTFKHTAPKRYNFRANLRWQNILNSPHSEEWLEKILNAMFFRAKFFWIHHKLVNAHLKPMSVWLQVQCFLVYPTKAPSLRVGINNMRSWKNAEDTFWQSASGCSDFWNPVKDGWHGETEDTWYYETPCLNSILLQTPRHCLKLSLDIY